MLDFILKLVGLRKKEKDNRPGYAGMSAQELAKVGIIPLEQNGMTIAGQRWRNAQIFSPIMYHIIRACFIIISLSFLVMVGSVFLRKSPLLLVSFPDGSVRCAGQNIDMSKHILKPRTAAQQKICTMLEQRWTTPLTNADPNAAALEQAQPQQAQPQQAQPQQAQPQQAQPQQAQPQQAQPQQAQPQHS